MTAASTIVRVRAPRRLALAVLLASTAMAVSAPGQVRRPPSDHDCAWVFYELGGKEQKYTGVVMDHGEAERGGAIGTALQPRCDQVAEHGPSDRIRDVFEVRGASRQLAIATESDYEPGKVHVHIRNGTFINLPSHPLHDLYFRTRRDPRLGEYLCKRTRWMRARLTVVPPPIGSDLFVTVRTGRLVTVTVHAKTVVRGARRVGGHPILRKGDRLRLKVKPCDGGNHRGTVVQRLEVVRG